MLEQSIEQGFKLGQLFLLVFASGLLFDFFSLIPSRIEHKGRKFVGSIICAGLCFYISKVSGFNTLELFAPPFYMILSIGFINRK